MTRKKVTLTQKQKVKVLLMEVDYHLMCLFDAVQSKNRRAINHEKRLLETKRAQLEDLGHYGGASEAGGI